MTSNSSQTPRSQARSAARLAAVQALYQHAMEGTGEARLLDEFHQHRLGMTDEEAEAEFADAEIDFFDDLVRGTLARSGEIDGILGAKLASGWTLARLDRTMLQILRAGTYELIARPDVPVAAAISEWIDVAKAFFDDKQAKFANGVLDAVAKEARA